jgi:RNA polymerase sigma-70 factor (ECF subfamily)
MTSSGELSANHFRDRDDRAFGALVDRHHSLVFRICMKFLGHQQDAEDVTQETFSRLAKYVDRWDRQRPLEPWLATIAGNRCRTFLANRSRRSECHQSLSDVLEPIGQDHLHADAANQLQEELTMALQALPDRLRTAFKMFHEQGLSYIEISDRIGHPVGTVKTWVHRARQDLIQRLRGRDVIPDDRSRPS